MLNIVRISDGLGNQLSEYAFARKLQQIKGNHVYLDIRFINNEDRVARGETNLMINDQRRYLLDKFKISLPVADSLLLSKWHYLIPQNRMEMLTLKIAEKGIWPWQYKDEEKIQKGKMIKMGNKLFPVYYKGYYFNLKYYQDIRPILLKEFRLQNSLKLTNELKRVLNYENTVSLHVRRGDFIRHHCSISRDKYYFRAIRRMNERIENPIYLVFSDDIEWVKKNLYICGDIRYISGMGFKDYEEFVIMQHCKHNIIANSTFSYWAAYLNNYSNKIVIYPTLWGKPELIPNGWVGM